MATFLTEKMPQINLVRCYEHPVFHDTDCGAFLHTDYIDFRVAQNGMITFQGKTLTLSQFVETIQIMDQAFKDSQTESNDRIEAIA